jgi:tripartite-type tricarboxylate transporter receptor subunit TctC
MAKATALALATMMTLTAAAAAQEWPTRPVTMVVPFTAGGPVDVAARLIAPRVSESLGQQIVVENMGGAGGMTGSNRVAKAAPDGYLLVLGNGGTHAYNQSLYKKPLYNSESDFAPVGVVVENTKVLIVRNDFPANSLPEFVAYVKANQDKLQYGSAGAGSATHIACLLLNYRMRTNVTHVPYRGAGPALQDLIAGRIDFMCEVISTGLPPIQSKLVKPIALLSTRRASVLPQLPTALAGPSRRRCRRLERLLLPEGNARPDRPPAQCRHQQGTGQPGAQRSHGRTRADGATGRPTHA